jgi:hypothetical protein
MVRDWGSILLLLTWHNSLGKRPPLYVIHLLPIHLLWNKYICKRVNQKENSMSQLQQLLNSIRIKIGVLNDRDLDIETNFHNWLLLDNATLKTPVQFIVMTFLVRECYGSPKKHENSLEFVKIRIEESLDKVLNEEFKKNLMCKMKNVITRVQFYI